MDTTLVPRQRPLLSKVGSILCLALLTAGPPLFGQPVGVIRGLDVDDGVSSTVLTLATSRKLEWTAIWQSAEVLQLTFPAAVARDDVADLAPESGLISAVAVRDGDSADRPATVVTISLRRPASFTSASSKRRIELTFVPVSGAAPSLVETGSEETSDEAAAPSPAGTGGGAAPDEERASVGVASAPTEVEPAAAQDEIASEYRIGPGDLLEVSVFGLDEFDRTVRVLRDGSISLPLLGGVRVAEMTLQEAESTIAGLLSERQLVNDPQVSFFVQEYVSRGVSVQGAVNKPGVYQMIQQRTLLEILGEAGGLTGGENDRAGQQIFVIRKSADGTQQRIEVNAEQLVSQGRADLNIPLVPGDVVLVPFAQKHRVYVSGAVARPGPVEYLSSEGITVLQAITAAGGPTERGNLGNVVILHRLADGSETRTAVNVKKIRKGKQQDVLLERNDTVIVGEWFF